MEKKVYKCGHSCSIILPKQILKQANLGDPTGKKLNVKAINGAIIITKPSDNMTDIDRLFSNFNYKKYNREVRKQNHGSLEYIP